MKSGLLERAPILFLVLASTLGAGACGHRHELPAAPPADARRAVNDLARENATTVWTKGAERYEFESADLRADSLVGFGPGRREAFSLDEVGSFSVKSRKRGIVDGLIVGSVVGLALGLIAPSEQQECTGGFLTGSCGRVTYSRSQLIRDSLIGGVGAGVLIGLWRKSTMTYEMRPVDSSSSGAVRIAPTFRNGVGVSVRWQRGGARP